MTMMKGNTRDAQSVLLGAKLWKKGMKIEGTVTRNFDTQNGTCSEILLKTPITVTGFLEKQKKVSIGALAGFKMALNAAGLDTLEANDRVIIECIGETPTNKGNARMDFVVSIDRPS